MSILVTGANGQLGFDLAGLLGGEAVGVDAEDFDITDETAVKIYVERLRPEAIIHCAAYTAVDKAEAEPERCYAVNALGTRYLAEAARDVGAKLLYVSTDYVFDGMLGRPYETDDVPNPIGVYGRTKLAGEDFVRAAQKECFIVRTSWVFGGHGGNFVKTMLRLGRERCEVRVVNDQLGSPTYTPHLAALLATMIRTDQYGVYHATNEGFCSWDEFARAIFRVAGMTVDVTPVTTEEYPTAAERPKDSRLSKASLDKAGFARLPGWESAVRDVVARGM